VWGGVPEFAYQQQDLNGGAVKTTSGYANPKNTSSTESVQNVPDSGLTPEVGRFRRLLSILTGTDSSLPQDDAKREEDKAIINNVRFISGMFYLS